MIYDEIAAGTHQGHPYTMKNDVNDVNIAINAMNNVIGSVIISV